MYFIVLDSLWNIYSLISHFYLALNFSLYFVNLAISSLIIFIVIVIQYKLIYESFIQSNPILLEDHTALRRKILLFYLIYHFFAFLLITNALTFFVNDNGILLNASTIMISYIISNISKQNLKHPPYIYLFSTIFNRLHLPLYFKLNPKNLFHIHTNENLIVSVIIILVIQYFVFLFQYIYNSYYFICCNSIKMRLELYNKDNAICVNEEYLIANKNLYTNSECLICLNALIDTVGSINVNDQSIISDNSLINDSKVEFEQNSKIHLKQNTCLLSGIYENFYKFHYLKNRIENKFVITECKHAFHKICISKWLEVKDECPLDRNKIILN